MELTHLRYHRQEILPGIGLEGQARLANAKVLVIGAGGLGCPALQYLAAAGVGHLGIADPDVVSLSNLHRQVLYGESDLGQMKVDVAKRRLLEINGALDIRIWPEVFGQEHCLQFINEYDVVLDATDQIASRYWISDACLLMKKILVFLSP
jgi:adenylyltransferase/sulfurtransferase